MKKTILTMVCALLAVALVPILTQAGAINVAVAKRVMASDMTPAQLINKTEKEIASNNSKATVHPEGYDEFMGTPKVKEAMRFCGLEDVQLYYDEQDNYNLICGCGFQSAEVLESHEVVATQGAIFLDKTPIGGKGVWKLSVVKFEVPEFLPTPVPVPTSLVGPVIPTE